MKKISIAILVLVVALVSCKKTPEVNLKYVDVERDLITVGMTTATVQCDYDYIATLKKAYFYYGEGANEADMNTAEMRVVQNTLYVDLTGLRANTTYSYFYEFHNGFNSMRTALKTFKTEASPAGVTLPTVVTATVTEITANSAKGGGEVTNDGGAEVTERGICWSTNANPTLNDNHVAAGTGLGAFTAAMSGLEANTTYHVRAYATNEAGTAYGLDREFVTDDGGCDCGYVDLGLPSGTLWATCNVGADCPEDYGDYFAWGETEPKSVYEWSNYKYCNGDQYQLTKYCNNSLWGYNGFTDTLTILQSIDDAATANWGDEWCMPTEEQWDELYDNTSSIWTTQNNIEGRLFIASNGNSIFLPATFIDEAKDNDRSGRYWSRTLCCSRPDNGMYFIFTNGQVSDNVVGMTRSDGCSVRPVRKSVTPTPPGGAPEGAINGLFTINENGDKVYFSQGNLQYQASTNTWRFAEKQWDYVGEDNNNISQTNNGWIDLFGWGTSGYNHGAICYQPWSTSTEYEDYYAYGDWQYNLFDQSGKADWGYNPISKGGDLENSGWRTLNGEEMEYLLDTRITVSGVRFSKAVVNNIKGVVLLPDDWSISYYSLNETNSESSYFTSNIIDASEWIVLEQQGAVFLPAAGDRVGEECEGFGSVGYYWLASQGQEFAIKFGFFENPFFLSCGSTYRNVGHSVRLVKSTP